MKVTDLETIFTALNESGVRYLVVGGIAVVAHGYERMTRDLDLVLALDEDPPETIDRFLSVLIDLGYRCSAPVSLQDFNNFQKRLQWVEEKGMVVLNLVSDDLQRVPIDLFVESPFAFDPAWKNALHVGITENLTIPVVNKTTLISMKEKAGRSIDLIDIEKLREIDDFGA